MTDGSEAGLQAERTELSWERTAIGALATAALLAARVPASSQPVEFLPSAATVLLALTLVVIGRQRGRQFASHLRPPPAGSVPVMVGGASVAAVGGMVAILSVL